jgi:phage I-like protein
LQEIEDSSEPVEIIRTGSFSHSLYGDFEITTDVLKSFKKNFDERARRIDIAVDYFHENYAEAAGWIKDIVLQDNDTRLFATVEWTEKALEKINKKEIKYLSAEFDLDYIDSETRKKYGPTLFGAGLTNRPHVKDMKPVFNEHDNNTIKKDDNMDFETILQAIGGLSDDQKIQIAEKLDLVTKKIENLDADKKLADDAKKLADDSVIKKLTDEVKILKANLDLQQKVAKFNEMFASGKVVEAQREAYLKGDMIAFAENAVKINLVAAGTSADNVSENQNNAVLFAEKVENYIKENGISYIDAYKIVAKSNPDLLK